MRWDRANALLVGPAHEFVDPLPQNEVHESEEAEDKEDDADGEAAIPRPIRLVRLGRATRSRLCGRSRHDAPSQLRRHAAHVKGFCETCNSAAPGSALPSSRRT